MPVTLPEGREKLYETIDAVNKERENKTHFTQGNPGGPGNPFARYVGTLRSAMLAAVKPEDLQQMIRVLIALAVNGDLAAARLVLQYTLGKPSAATDPDRADLDEAKMHLEGSTKPADVQAMLHSMPPNFVNVMAEEVRPIVLKKNMDEAERRSAEEAADRALREAEMTAEEDAWEAAERSQRAPQPAAPGAERQEHRAKHEECNRPPSPNGNFREAAPSTNDLLNLTRPLTSGEVDQLLQSWTRENRPAG